MNILIIGSGGREHAIGFKIKQSKEVKQIFFAPGNGGTAQIGTNVDINADEVDKLAAYALENDIDFTIVGPEIPLKLGIVDVFRKFNLKILGPDKNGAQLETSKVFAKSFMTKYNIPTARYETYTDIEKALCALENWKYPLVIKADGLAAGKGVIICDTKKLALEAVDEIMRKKIFGSAGEKIIIEEFLEGKEVSLLCFTDGTTIIPMESAFDYKRALDNNKGLNTGGMGSISPAPHYTDEIGAEIVQKTLKGIQSEGLDFRGIIYIGLMVIKDCSKVLEYNVRFGDPETEALMLRLDSSLLEILCAIESKTLADIKPIKWKSDASICVVMSSGGYPSLYETGYPIELFSPQDDITIFHAGTKLEDGALKTSGGRVLMICATGHTIEQARELVYKNIKKISFKSQAYRNDIGLGDEIK